MMMKSIKSIIILCLLVINAFAGQTSFTHPTSAQVNQYFYAYVYQVPLGGPIVIKAVNPDIPTDSILLYSTTLPGNAPLYGALASPDGQWIVLIPDAVGDSLRLIEVATGQMRDVRYMGLAFDFPDGALLGQLQNIAWAPNSQSLAFAALITNHMIDVFVYSLADDTLTNLSNDPALQFAVAWSSDSNYLASGGLACDGADCDVQIDVFDWTTRSRVTSQSPVWADQTSINTIACQLHWSPDAHYLSFVASCDGTNPGLEKELFLLDRIEGTVVPLTDYTQTAYQPPDAPVEYPVRLATYDIGWYDTDTFFLGETYGQGNLNDYIIISQTTRYEVPTGSQTILRADVMAEDWTRNPVQNQFAFRTASGYSPRTYRGVEIVNIADGILTTIGAGPAGCDLVWSPDGTTLAYTGRVQPMTSCYDPVNALYFMDGTTGQLTQYIAAETGAARATGWVRIQSNVSPEANAGPDQTLPDADTLCPATGSTYTLNAPDMFLNRVHSTVGQGGFQDINWRPVPCHGPVGTYSLNLRRSISSWLH